MERHSKGRFSSGGDASSFNCTFGIYRTPTSWIKEARLIEPPFDVYHAVPDHLLRVLFDFLTMGPATVMRRRNALLNKWIGWASEMNVQESQLKISIGGRSP